MFTYKGIIILCLSFLTSYCFEDQKTTYQYAKSDIERFKQIHKSVPLSIFNNWNISARYDIMYFDFDIYRLVVKTNSTNQLMFLENLPKQDTAFFLLADKKRKNNYPFSLTDLSSMYRIVKNMKVSKVIFRDDYGFIIFVLEHSTLIYTDKQVDISAIKRFEVYEKYDSNWYYSTLHCSTLQHPKE